LDKEVRHGARQSLEELRLISDILAPNIIVGSNPWLAHGRGASVKPLTRMRGI
jgi:hypothetical protein